MRCRLCGASLAPDLTVAVKTASTYASCAWRCDSCKVGYSNAREEKRRQAIFASPEGNVPAPLRDGLREALAGSCCVGARRSKLTSFCSLGSEDAVTWSVFGVLRRIGRLDRLAWLCGLGGEATGPGSLLLWGYPICGPLAPTLAQQLASVSDAIGEDIDWRTEPDVVLAWPQVLIVTEAKTGSPNERLPESEKTKIDRYTTNTNIFAASAETIRDLRYYELVRNWRIAADLADTADIPISVVVNLGPEKIRGDVLTLRQVIAGVNRRLEHLRWRDLMTSIELPDWFDGYAESRALTKI